MAKRLDAKQNPTRGLDHDASLEERTATREERIQQQHAILEQRRKSRPISSGMRVSSGYAQSRPSSGYAQARPSTGFVPKPPASRSQQEKARSARSPSTGSVKPFSAGLMDTDGGGFQSQSAAMAAEPSATSYRANASDAATGGDDSVTQKRLAQSNIRGDVDYSEKAKSHRAPPATTTFDFEPEATAAAARGVDDDSDGFGGEVGGRDGRDAVVTEELVPAVTRPTRQFSRADSDDESTAASPEGAPSAAHSTSPASQCSSPGSSDQVIGAAKEDHRSGDTGVNQNPNIVHVETGEVAEFVDRAVPSEDTMRCRFTRKDGTYYLHLELPDNNKKFLMAARSRRNARSKDVLLSLDSIDISKHSAGYIGKLQCNLTGSEFTLFSHGANPTKSRALPDHSNVREELVAIHYGKNVFGLGGPRKMTVILPHLNQDNERIRIYPRQESETLLESFKTDTLPVTSVVLENKHAQWSAEDYIVMQFGRVGEDQFTLDFSYPLCPVQAFGIALSSCFKNFNQ